MKKLFALIITGLCLICQADEKTNTNTPSQTGAVVQLTVDGLVCNFCATNISKTFSKLPEVSEVYVNLTAKAVLLQLKEGQKLPEEKTKQIVTDAGFNLRGISYPKDSFNSIKENLKKSAK
jgi:copper chaperone CopZ